MAKNQYIDGLNKLGQVVWYDNISREILVSGELKSLIDSGVSGLTSNPSIFKNAIAESASYDTEIKSMAKAGKSSAEICEELMIGDVAQAADLLLPVYNSLNAKDGYASIEVSPLLAADTNSTIEEARRLWKKLNRKNVMIKVPATSEGIPALEALIKDGINVNVTLIFSVEVYTKVAQAYVRALKARALAGLPVANIASVASFFVSRVDSISEKGFDALIQAGKADAAKKKEFEGKIGIANSKLAYLTYQQIFFAKEFVELQTKGALVQRCLWASTGTKNPAFSPVLYVEELAGRDTVNTMPPQTVAALMKGAKIEPRLERDLDQAQALVAEAKRIGLPFDAQLVALQEQGVELFADAYKSLLASIEAKRKAFLNS